MTRNRVIILFVIIFSFLVTSVSFSQDTDTTATEDKTINETTETEDTAAPETEKVAVDENKAEKPAEEAFKHNSPKAAMYDDGITVFTNTRVKYQLTAKDNAETDKSFYKVNSDPEQEYKAPFGILQEGKNTVEYYSVDKMGNKEQQKTLAVTVDNTAPATMVKSDKPIYMAQEKYYVSGSYLFTVVSIDGASGVGDIQYSLDGQSYQAYKASFSIGDKTEAVIKIRSVDNVLNTTDNYSMLLKENAEKPETKDGDTVSLTIDNDAPAVTISTDKDLKQKDGKNVVTADYRYSISAEDGGSGLAKIYYRIDKAEKWVPYEKPLEFSIFGEHRIEAMAVDNVGNSSTPVALSVVVDIVPPAVEDTTAE